MGFRLSLKTISKEEWARCLTTPSASSYEDLNVNIIEDIIYDWCTDVCIPMFVSNAIPRLTEQKLEDEDDVYIGVLTEEVFKDLLRAIHEKASHYELDWHDELSALADTSDKYMYGYATSWHSAFYTGIHILKTIDWEKNVILAKIS